MAGELGYVRVRSGEFRQASWGSLVLGKFRYVVFSFWLGRYGAVRPFGWVGVRPGLIRRGRRGIIW